MRSPQNLPAPVLFLAVAALAMLTLVGCSYSSLRDFSFFSDENKSDVAAFSPSENPVKLAIWHDSMESAQLMSESTGKPILADFTGSDWCGWCKKLKRDVFDTDEFKEWAHENVVLLEVDFPHHSGQSPEIKSQNEQLKEKYGISGYPTVLLLSPAGDVVGKLGYKKEPSEWIDAAELRLAGRSNPTDIH